MNIRNTHDEFGSISKILHWLIAISMITLIAIGWYMTGLDDESVLYWRMLDLHEALGLSVFVLFLVKVAWMILSPNPSLLPELARWERFAARVVHTTFIVAIALISVTGFLFAASNGEAINLYDVIEIPDIGQLSKSVRATLSDVHMYMAYGCAALIVVHIAAALKHHFIDLDNTLRRITF